MIDLKCIKLTDILPPNLATDELVKTVATVCDLGLSQVYKRIVALILYARIDDLDEETVDDLAWQFHVDYYDIGLSLEKKRALVKSAIRDHKYKGTPWAVKSVVKSIRGDVDIVEWFDYGGDPYHFRIEGFDGAMVTAKELERLVAAIGTVKNTRSWLDGVAFRRTVPVARYKQTASYLHRRVDVSLQPPTIPAITADRYRGLAIYQHKELRVNV